MNEYRRLRLTAGKSLAEASKEIGVHISTLVNWEKGRYNPHPQRFKAIAQTYGCAMEDIVKAYAAQD